MLIIVAKVIEEHNQQRYPRQTREDLNGQRQGAPNTIKNKERKQTTRSRRNEMRDMLQRWSDSPAKTETKVSPRRLTQASTSIIDDGVQL